MRILFLARRFYPDIGGVEKHVLEIGKIMVKDGHNVTVVTQSHGKQNIIDGIKIIRIPKTPEGKSEKFYVWKWFWINRNLIREADVIHAHDVYWWYWPYRFIFLSKKSFATFHGWEQVFPIPNKFILIRKFSEMLASGSIGVGNLKKWYYTNPDFIIYGAVDPSFYKLSKIKIKKQKKIIKIGLIGRLDEDIGVNEIVSALILLKKKNVKFKFEILGDGEFREKVSKIGKVHGFIKITRSILNQFDIIFASSYLSIMESLSVGKPVVSVYTNLFSKDVLSNTPFSKSINLESEPAEIANIILRITKNYKKEIIKVNKTQKWLKQQDWINIVRIYKKLWKIE